MPRHDGRIPLKEQRDTRLAAQATRILWNPNASHAQKAVAASVFLPDASDLTESKK